MKSCQTNGCARPVHAKGLCGNHYRNWREKKIACGLPSADPLIRDLIQQHLPATRLELAEKIDCAPRSIYITIPVLRAENKVHVAGHAPPASRNGRWQEVFAWGAGLDAVLDPAVVAAHKNERRRKAARGAA